MVLRAVRECYLVGSGGAWGEPPGYYPLLTYTDFFGDRSLNANKNEASYCLNPPPPKFSASYVHASGEDANFLLLTSN